VRKREAHDPLRGHSWRDGVEPPATQPQPVQQQQQEEPEFDWNPHSKRNIMARRAAALIREKYRIESGDVRRMAQHDGEMKQIWTQLMEGTYQPPASTVQMPSAEYKAIQAAQDPRNWR